MKIELKNYELVPAVSFLSDMSIKANEVRPVTKLKKLLISAVEDLQESQQELIKEYGQKDEQGELLVNDQGEYVFEPKQKAAYLAELKKLYDEVVVIDGGIHAKVIEKLGGILAGYTVEISGKDAEVYDRLLDEFEKVEGANE